MPSLVANKLVIYSDLIGNFCQKAMATVPLAIKMDTHLKLRIASQMTISFYIRTVDICLSVNICLTSARLLVTLNLKSDFIYYLSFCVVLAKGRVNLASLTPFSLSQ